LFLKWDTSKETNLLNCFPINTVIDAKSLQGNYTLSCNLNYRKEPTAIKYFGDGSGRDGYVIKESGGLIPSYHGTDPLKTFYGSLRNSPKN
jgi:hypothetical protein